MVKRFVNIGLANLDTEVKLRSELEKIIE